MPSLALRGRIEATASHRPWCGVYKNAGRVLPLDRAIDLPYMQLNPPFMAYWLQFDIDRKEAAHAWEEAGLPPPTYVAINRENQHAQYGYALAAPVCTSEAARVKPLLYLAAIEHGYNRKLRADLAFHGPLAKNPLHDRWLLWQPAGNTQYELGELAEYASLPSLADLRRGRVNVDYAALGRNCTLFERLRVWAYGAVRDFWRPEGYDLFRDQAIRVAESLNAQFARPLLLSEIRSLVRSVTKWVWRKFTPADFRKLQAARGRRKGAAKRDGLMSDVLRLIAEGNSQREVARIVGVDQKTVGNWMRRNQPEAE
jgi:hypothetical protein